ncbi:MAG: GSCFA domain-containing protein [Taibaiella sp.]|nr:GSCFA domain-containing protein [Taibaiella sp.]
MQFQLPLDIERLPTPITYKDKILLTGSCFTEHISGRLAQYKFNVLANPNGILFNPMSVAESIDSYLDGRVYEPQDLFPLNELWNSWQHHTRFSHIDKTEALNNINTAQKEAAAFVKSADKIIITLGSAFQYYLKEGNKGVANNHRGPAQWFHKTLLSIDTIVNALGNTLQKLSTANPYATVIFTISPVRHVRDGVIENNRSKARLVEAVHTLCSTYPNTYYFPSYELVIDILRDHRYYDIDLVHPNYAATSYVWHQFEKACIDAQTINIMKEVQDIVTAYHHKPRFPETEGHRNFMKMYSAKIKDLQERHPYLNLKEEISYFG